jgi:hypothetical protein
MLWAIEVASASRGWVYHELLLISSASRYGLYAAREGPPGIKYRRI